MVASTLGFAVGVIAPLWLPKLPPLQFLPAGLVAVPMIMAGGRCRIAGMAMAGFCYCWLAAGIELAERLPSTLDGRQFTVEGVVDALPQQEEGRARFNLSVTSLVGPDGRVEGPDRLRLSWYDDVPRLAPGQRWRLTVKLRRPHGFFNPGGFDYERWLLREGIDATGYVRLDKAPARLESSFPAGLLSRWRERLSRQVTEAVESGRGGTHLLRALAVGDRRGLDDDDWRVLNATGTSHLVAISGLHVGLVATLGLLLGAGLARVMPAALRLMPARHWGAILALVLAIGYSALAGFSLPTRRALVMVAGALAAILSRRVTRAPAVLTLALGLVLVLDPLAPLGAGFWLSFLAVGTLLAAFAGRLGVRSRLADGARAQLVVALGLAVPVALFFQRVAWAAPMVNMLAVPVVGLGAVPLALTGTALIQVPGIPGDWALVAAARILEAFWQVATWLAVRPELVRAVPAPPPWAAACAMAGAAWLMAPRAVPGRALGVVLLMPVFCGLQASPAHGSFRPSVLDVGQGLAAVIRTRDHVLVYDTGPRFPSGFNTAEAVVAPYLLQETGGRLDGLVVSHGDSDHAGGAGWLAGRFDPRLVLAGETGLAASRPCHDGRSWRRDGVRFRILHPAPGMPDRGNDSSCVLLVSGRGKRALLTGDITHRVERKLVGRYGSDLEADVMVAPHHGSASSSSPDFIHAVRPRAVVFSVGRGNRFGLPDPDVVDRYRKTGASLYATSSAGMVRFEPGRDVRHAVSWRRYAGRYWTHRPGDFHRRAIR